MLACEDGVKQKKKCVLFCLLVLFLFLYHLSVLHFFDFVVLQAENEMSG